MLINPTAPGIRLDRRAKTIGVVKLRDEAEIGQSQLVVQAKQPAPAFQEVFHRLKARAQSNVETTFSARFHRSKNISGRSGFVTVAFLRRFPDRIAGPMPGRGVGRKSGGEGYSSSNHSRIAMDSFSGVPSTMRHGTVPIGFSFRELHL